ncbi:hypothetical protein FYC62_03170 [Pedobacter aquae]|uniref:Uncharacterized protein n=1 Tax=Pedobacter aquae TaxID=2605747 RepID=A0A5C0VHS4_9SPHI|nr:hypothetical protein [Pedobacter aquae]QEK50780.1 hypothetical protein FYC62_03170 [Pedobacter aquae]
MNFICQKYDVYIVSVSVWCRSMLAANGVGISDVADFTHQSRYEAPQLIKVKMFNRSTSAAILLIPC